MVSREILFNGEAIGLLVNGPNDEMLIEYMPFRSLLHLEFVRSLEQAEGGESKIQIDIEGTLFTAIEIVRPHFIRVA